MARRPAPPSRTGMPDADALSEIAGDVKPITTMSIMKPIIKQTRFNKTQGLRIPKPPAQPRGK